MRAGRRIAGRLAALLALTASAAATATTATAQSPEAGFATVEVLSVPSRATLLGVSFPDATHGYAVGDRGVILATTDGGATWQEQASGVEALNPGTSCDPLCTNALRDVDFVSATTGWVVGADGIVLHTSNGGATWVRQQLPPLDSIGGLGPGPGGTDLRAPDWEDLFSVSFSDARTGVVVGPGGTILNTADGGATWAWRGDRRYGGLNAVAFSDRQHGRAVGDSATGLTPFITVATADGGATWEIQAPPARGEAANANFTAVSFTDARRGYIAGNSGRIFATADGGRSWAVQRSDTTEDFQDVAFVGDGRGVAVGFTEFSGNRRASLVTTGDGGETWIPRLVEGTILWGVDFATPTTAYAVGCNVFPTEGQIRTCGRSLIARITFPAASGGGGGAAGAGGGSGSGGDGTGLSLLMIVAAGAAILVIAAVVATRRRRGH